MTRGLLFFLFSAQGSQRSKVRNLTTLVELLRDAAGEFF